MTVTAAQKVGLLGAGYIAKWHADAIKRVPGVKLGGVCDLNLGLAEGLARSTGARAYGSLEDMLADGGFSAIHVLTPPHVHFEATKKILAAGVAAFVEKPFVLSSREALELDAFAKEKKTPLGVNHNFLMLPGYDAFRRDLASGALGPVDAFEANWRFPLAPLRAGPYGLWMLREPKNILLELGPHLFAFVADIFGELDIRDVLLRYPIAIPGGSTHFQGWRISGTAGAAAVTLDLSLIEGHDDRSIAARALGGMARFDFGADVYLSERAAMGDIVIGPFAAQTGRAAKSFGAGARNAARQLASLNALSPYGLSFVQACRSFYGSLKAGTPVDKRLSAGLAATALSMIEAAIEKAGPKLKVPPKISAPAAARPTMLVIGGSGFIGRALVADLADSGHSVRVFSRGKAPGFERADGRVEVFSGDLKSEKDLLAAMEGIDGVFHLARADEKTWSGYLENDVGVTRRIGECCLKAGVKRLVYTGTIASFDASVPGAVVKENAPLDPQIDRRDLYARSKGACETALKELQRDKGLKLVIARPGIVIGRGGPLQHWGVAMWRGSTACKLWGKGDNPLPFVSIEDTVSGLRLAMTTAGVEGRAFFLVGDPMLSARDYFAEISRIYGVRMRAKPTPIWTYYAVDLVKYFLKRHLARKTDIARPTFHDWKNRAAFSIYDNSDAKAALGWSPESDRDKFVAKAIADAELFGFPPKTSRETWRSASTGGLQSGPASVSLNSTPEKASG